MTPIDQRWLRKVSYNLRETTREIRFETRYGEVIVPEGFRFDKFSHVPDTPYPEFWKAALLHDYTRRELLKRGSTCVVDTLKKTDIVFRDEMLVQSAIIFIKLREEHGMKFCVKVYLGLLTRAFVYFRGVRSLPGRLYHYIGKWF